MLSFQGSCSLSALIALETSYAISNLQGTRLGAFAVKLDMMKAYDRVEWVFLQHVLLQLGFPTIWVRLVMGCVVLMNFGRGYGV